MKEINFTESYALDIAVRGRSRRFRGAQFAEATALSSAAVSITIEEQILQHHSVVVRNIVRGVDKRDRSLPHEFT